jgi:hypothetical protein
VEVDVAGLSEDVKEVGCDGRGVRESVVAVVAGGELGQEPMQGSQESGNRMDTWRKSSRRSAGAVGSGSAERRRLRVLWKGRAAAPGRWVSVRRGMAWWQRRRWCGGSGRGEAEAGRHEVRGAVDWWSGESVTDW